MTGWQCFDRLEHGVRSPDSFPTEITVHSRGIQSGGEVWELLEGPDFGGEPHTTAVGSAVVIQRLHSRVVDNQLQRRWPVPGIDDRDGIHPF
jgi:hypothetical protein